MQEGFWIWHKGCTDTQGFFMPRWCAQFSGRAQERLQNLAIAEDARVSGLESLDVRLTLAECPPVEEEVPMGHFAAEVTAIPTPSRAGILGAFPGSDREVLDSIDLEKQVSCVAELSRPCERKMPPSRTACPRSDEPPGPKWRSLRMEVVLSVARVVSPRQGVQQSCATGSICSPQPSGKGCGKKFSPHFAFNPKCPTHVHRRVRNRKQSRRAQSAVGRGDESEIVLDFSSLDTWD